jgi:hypothetical protein
MSFGWTCMFRHGSWLEFRRFALLQRQNTPSRVALINAELARIGNVSIAYKIEGDSCTEARDGFVVDPSTSLGKLMRAYIAQGGNPFDISMFLHPDSFRFIEDAQQGGFDDETRRVGEFRVLETQPYGGIVYPESNDEFEGVDTSGWLPLWKYPPRKLGSNEANIFPEADQIGSQIRKVKKVFAQEISHLRNNLEARILKLCDLREQLIRERDELLVNALSGSVVVLEDFDPSIMLESDHLSHIVTNIDLEFYNPLERDGVIVPDFNSHKGIRPPTTLYQCLLDDAPTKEEDFTAL